MNWTRIEQRKPIATQCVGFYHNSWNWLMPVVEKICKTKVDDPEIINNGENSYFETYYMRTFGMICSETNDYMVRINRFPLHKSSSLLDATFNAVIEFILWVDLNPNH